jgi:cell division protein FtsL
MVNYNYNYIILHSVVLLLLIICLILSIISVITDKYIIDKYITNTYKINYNEESLIDNMSPVIIEDRIISIVSNSKTVLTIDKNILIDDIIKVDGFNKHIDIINGLFIVVLQRPINTKELLIIKDIKLFDTLTNFDTMVNYINKINCNDIIIVLSKGNPFYKSFDLSIFRKFGSTVDQFSSESNYMLIGSQNFNIYYETISDDTIYFPYIEVVETLHKQNPMSSTTYPIANNLFYMETVSTDEQITRCAMESVIRGYDKFGIYNNKCIPVNNTTYNNIKSFTSDSSRPLVDSNNNINNYASDSMGNNASNIISKYLYLYKFNKKLSMNNLITKQKDGVITYPNKSYSGFVTILAEGDYYADTNNILSNIRSIRIPDDYYVLLNIDNNITTYVGFNNIDNISKNIRSIIIRKLKNNSVIFCDKENRCYIFGPGKHILSPEQFLTITNVTFKRVGLVKENTQEVNLYNSYSFKDIDLIQRVSNTKDLKHVINYPVIVRAIWII